MMDVRVTDRGIQGYARSPIACRCKACDENRMLRAILAALIKQAGGRIEVRSGELVSAPTVRLEAWYDINKDVHVFVLDETGSVNERTP